MGESAAKKFENNRESKEEFDRVRQNTTQLQNKYHLLSLKNAEEE